MKKEKKKKGNPELSAVANMLYEAGALAYTPRSWTGFLGSGKQSVAEHLNRVAIIGYSLGMLARERGETIDIGELLTICLFHDFNEARVSDLNYVHQKYATVDEEKAIHDFTEHLPFGAQIRDTLHRYEERTSLESKLAKDADNLEFILSLKEQADIGNTRTLASIPNAVKRLKTPIAQELAKIILETSSDNWWFVDRDSEWWVHRNHKRKE